ncbi:Ankyrin repeat [Dillenia turbinata]|uniref:Ankyrin repeat n=1 Tax=Dillenia turbinata TaxID=194707 RepID=A0AAN8WA24_9MAGN
MIDTGDWKRAEAIFDQDESALTAKINPFGYNALQIAVELGHARFAVNTINRIPLEALKDRTNTGNTALNVAARSDCIDAARALVQRDPDLTQTRCNGNRAPILEAAINGSKAVLQFLCSATRDEDPSPFRGNDGAWVLYNAIANGLFDAAIADSFSRQNACDEKAFVLIKIQKVKLETSHQRRQSQ